jgi:hypothetical protein
MIVFAKVGVKPQLHRQLGVTQWTFRKQKDVMDWAILAQVPAAAGYEKRQVISLW